MTLFSLTSLSSTPALTDEMTLNATMDCLLEHLSVPTQGDCTRRTLFEILIRAASKQDSIEHTTQRLAGAPTGNTVRYHLDKLQDMHQLEAQLNQTLQSRLPQRVAKGKHRLAIDLHLLPYYGTPTPAEAPYIYRSQAKAGTSSFFAYATVYVITRHKRVTLAIHPVHRQETLVATLTYLLAALFPLRLRIKRLYLDRGFFSVSVIRWLKALNLPFIMPAIIRGKQGGTRQLLQTRKSYFTTYTLRGKRVKFITATALVQHLQQAKLNLQLPQALVKLDRYDLLVVDDLGYVKKSEAETSVLFELIAHRYERKSLLITANQPFSTWESIFGDSMMTVAAIDRLIHHAIILEMQGESFRQQAAKQRTQSSSQTNAKGA